MSPGFSLVIGTLLGFVPLGVLALVCGEDAELGGADVADEADDAELGGAEVADEAEDATLDPPEAVLPPTVTFEVTVTVPPPAVSVRLPW
ncbi:hypothetical protein GIS00_23770 [Nakamurella sp. YIM 132087]|uniref:Uncharacterized protein n=1 Tax=Nakamurella alba TaxID=2665158 RepID=A0A7K1FS45_9ACTN|nr:hypothetical protein [Nakamurella alba]MTD16958.1 hypothetical protein [Nakamurella alba]